MSQPSPLGLFNTNLIAFFQDLSETYPEEREIKQALDALKMAKQVNPKLILDLFTEYVYKPLSEKIIQEDEEYVIGYAKVSIQTQFNEMGPALMIFDKHWPAMSEENRKAIWKWLKLLVRLSEMARK